MNDYGKIPGHQGGDIVNGGRLTGCEHPQFVEFSSDDRDILVSITKKWPLAGQPDSKNRLFYVLNSDSGKIIRRFEASTPPWLWWENEAAK